MLIISTYRQLFGADTYPGPVSQNAEFMGQQANCFVIFILQSSLLLVIEHRGLLFRLN